jgi:hypothetical protein
MTERIIKHYDPPVPFHKFTPAVSVIARPKNPTKPKSSRVARNVAIDDDEDGVIPSTKGNNMTDNIDRGPFAKIMDKMALARQAQTGWSYEKSYTDCYTDPRNAAIRDGVRYDELSRALDSSHGTAKCLIPVAKAESYDPLAKAAEAAEHLGPAHAKLHSLAIDHQRARPGMSYQSAYGYLYSKPENAALRNAVKAEHMRSTMGYDDQGVSKAAAPPDAVQDDVGSAHAELNDRVMAHMKSNPALSYERAFTHIYLHPNNRALKDRVDSESVLRAQARAPAPAFPRYTAPGHRGAPSNIGRIGSRPRGNVGG